MKAPRRLAITLLLPAAGAFCAAHAGTPEAASPTTSESSGGPESSTGQSRPANGRAPTPGTRQYRFGLTLVTPVAGIVEQRTPVSLRDGASGRMRAWSYGAEIAARSLSEDLVAYGSFDYRRTDFAFEGTPAPWGDTDQYRLNAHVESKIDDAWWWFANGGLRLGAEREAALADSLTGRVSLGGKCRFSRAFSVYAGLGAATRLDDSAQFMPMLGLEYRSGRWSLRTLNGVVASYDTFGDGSLVLDASLLYENSHLRLRDEPATGSSRAVEFQEVPVSLGVTRNFGRFSFVRAYAACIVWSDYRFRTEGRTTGDFQTAPGALFGLSAGARF